MQNLWCAVAISVAASQAFAQQVELTPQQVQIVASNAYSAGDLARAVQLSDALLTRDPRDLGALIIRTQAAFDLSDFAGAARYAGRAYRASEDQETKYTAARYAARANAEIGRLTRAQFWLRLARENAGTPEASQSVAEDYRYLSRENPLSFNLRFGISPTSNLNGGTDIETIEFLLFGQQQVSDLSGDARALSGLEITAGFNASYRLSASDTAATFFNADVDFRTYLLSKSAQEQAPNVEGREFSDADIGIGLTHRRILRDGMQPTDLSVVIGQSWYATDPYTRYLSLSASQDWAISDRTQFGVGLSYRLTDYLTDNQFSDGTQPDADVTKGIRLSWQQAIGAGDMLDFTIGVRDNTSDIARRNYVARYVSASYNIGQPIAGVSFGLGLYYEDRQYAFSFYNNGGPRQDETIAGSVTARFNDIEYYGFAPVVRLDASRTMSDVDLFDSDTLALGLDLVSSF